ncbi:hypothetical protein E3Q22_01250 [Wallemia mellicola]|uniref:Uncharacterized protein n=1 Tax=Wallemia mellicola TaxID=1708541 RepID=A0A4T0P4G0_9BASI|nr:hypothetical protein E3Q24_00208 [Wallemia mellicola]TIB78533.1 hypothetical protein E3Q23_00729 [Wallemia mellicola]TIB81264.1 hypothetical protein E3Q22_01250 [Wallemia mellicola]TIB89174.1 hypothetical protein E3Q21_00732 [Wallemia mellicola]TIB91606.1 hypothetical protein E3Q20_00718 [Wallemia mellicola]
MTSESEFGKSASLDSSCNDFKNAYDRCFNQWFDKYLEHYSQQRIEQSTETYEKNCGGLFKKYSECLEVGLS